MAVHSSLVSRLSVDWSVGQSAVCRCVGWSVVLRLVRRSVGCPSGGPSVSRLSIGWFAGQSAVHRLVGRPVSCLLLRRSVGCFAVQSAVRRSVDRSGVCRWICRSLGRSSVDHSVTFEHVHAGLGVVAHGVHEDGRQELGQHDLHLGADQFVRHHFGEEVGGPLPHRGVGGVTEQVQQIDERPWVHKRAGSSSRY